ncbi:MAG: PqiC family protein, partial [Cellvibrionaceae bacterium]|nr:PqiC family protein [Cellvibrionaceae bacterium]
MARGLVSIKRSAVIAVLSGICAACISPSPATQYFSLFAIKQVETQRSELPDKSLSFGVGPIVIPEYMDNPSIVSVSDRQQVQVSGEHAWAGDLRAAMGRVLADNLAQYWVLDKVSAFPWDNRARPAYQLRLVFEEFGGRRGGEVHLRVFW